MTDLFSTRLGPLLRSARDRAGLTQAAVARFCGTDASAVARWEAGTRTPSLASLTLALRVLGGELTLVEGGYRWRDVQ